MSDERQFGWIRDEDGFRVYGATLDSGDEFWDQLRTTEDDGDRFYYRALCLCLQDSNQVHWIKDGRLRAYNQGNVGSCVGNAEAKRAAHIAALDVYLRLEPETFKGMFSPEWAYYASRKESNLLHSRGDGSTGFGAAKAATNHGALVQGMYGSYDLSSYSVDRCRQWGRGDDIPTAAIAEAGQHRYGRYLKVDTAEKVWLCAGAGLPVNFCSNQGFETSRDEDGACRPRGSWSHSMCGCSARYTTKNGRKLVLVENSWGDEYSSGPWYGDQPWGSFYADLSVLGDMAKIGDTFVDVGYVGHVLPRPPMSFTEM